MWSNSEGKKADRRDRTCHIYLFLRQGNITQYHKYTLIFLGGKSRKTGKTLHTKCLRLY